MTYNVPTRYEEMVLLLKVRTNDEQVIRITVSDADQPNTVFTNRYKPVTGENIFFVRMPVSGNNVLVDIYNEAYGNLRTGQDNTFEVLSITKEPLDKKLDVIDFANPFVRSFVNFATRFCYNAGSIPTGNYVSDDGRFVIKYLSTIQDNGEEQTTPARIDIDNGIIEISKKQFIDLTVPNRMAILLHEFAHVYLNDDVDNEIEADLNGLLIYLGLGYPRIEAFEVFAVMFMKADTEENKERFDIIKKFIDDFEEQNTFLYE